MESRNRYVREQHNELMVDFYKLESSYKFIDREYKEQNKLLEEVFNENELLRKENERLKKDKT